MYYIHKTLKKIETRSLGRDPLSVGGTRPSYRTGMMYKKIKNKKSPSQPIPVSYDDDFFLAVSILFGLGLGWVGFSWTY